MKKIFAIVLGLTFVLAAAGCSDGFTTDSSLTKHEWPIINGTPVHMNAPYGAVVSIHDNSRQGISIYPFCSGTLIADDVILTAGHCMERTKPSAVAIYFGDSAPAEYTAGTLTYDDFHMASDVQVHPQYNSRQITNDIALIRLSAPVTGITPVPALPMSEGFTSADGAVLDNDGNVLTPGIDLDFAGFGMDENDEYGVKLHLVGSLHHLQGDHQIYYNQPLSDGGPCSGDSGGPAFINRGGTTYVAGITSYGDANCAIYGVSTRTDFFETFINDFTGTGGGTDPQPECNVDTDCPSGFVCTNNTCIEEPANTGDCGNGVCDLAGGESCDSCPDDCVTGPVHKGACCGDGICYRKESVDQCPADCP